MHPIIRDSGRVSELREVARFWRHPGLPRVDLLRARFVRHRYGRHTHEGYAIGVIEAGVQEWYCRGATHRAGPGGMVFVGPGEVHDGHAGVPEGWAYRMLYPPVDLVIDVAADLGLAAGTPRFPDDPVYDPVAADGLRAAHRAADGGDDLAASGAIRSALATLLRRHAQPHRASRPVWTTPVAVAAARDILHERFVDPPSLHDLAAEVGAGPFALLRGFRAATGLPPHAYLNQERVRRARALLDDGTQPAEAAVRTGFADQAHLTRHFKRIVGVPPGAYRTARTFKTGGAGAARRRCGPGCGAAMTVWIAVLVTGIACYALKYAGLAIPRPVIDRPRVRRFAAAVPVALLSALVAIQAAASGQALVVDAPRLAGLGAAVVALLLRAPFLVVLMVAAGVAAGLRALGAG